MCTNGIPSYYWCTTSKHTSVIPELWLYDIGSYEDYVTYLDE